MIHTDKKLYTDTILLLRNQKDLPNIFVELKKFIKEHLKIDAINFVFKQIKDSTPLRYNLKILILNNKDYEKMMDISRCKYDENKQKLIANKFYELALKYNYTSKENAENIWVSYIDFNSELKSETITAASKEAFLFIREKYNDLPIWDMFVQYIGLVIFYETDLQLKKYSENNTNSKIIKEFYQILKKYDEFGCYNFNEFEKALMTFDSKETLDKYYNGNLYYYFK